MQSANFNLRKHLALSLMALALTAPTAKGELKATGFNGLNLYMTLNQAQSALTAIFGPGWQRKAKVETMQSYAEKVKVVQAHEPLNAAVGGSLVRSIQIQDFTDRTHPRVTVYFEEDYPKAPGTVIVVGIRYFFATGDTETDQASNLQSLKSKFGAPNCGDDINATFRVWTREPRFNCSGVAVLFADPRVPQQFSAARNPGKLAFPLLYQARQAHKDSWLELADYPAYNLRQAAMQTDLDKLSTAPKVKY